jgi:mono/diheme cytochrome c family protein
LSAGAFGVLKLKSTPGDSMRKHSWLAIILLFLASATLSAVSGPEAGAAVPKKRGSDYVEGKKIWKRSCWQCHGLKAEGDGPAAEAMVGGVPTLRGGIIVKPKRNDFMRSVLDGKGLMPAFSAEMERPDAKRVIIYLEKLDERNGVEPEEEDKEEDKEEDEEAENGAEAGDEEGDEEGNEAQTPEVRVPKIPGMPGAPQFPQFPKPPQLPEAPQPPENP